MKIELLKLYYFTEIVESDFNLTVASQRIHISQSALSQFITKIEDNEGYDLFYRQKNRLEGLTPYGEVLYKYAKEIILLYDEMDHNLQQIKSNEKEVIRFGSTVAYIRMLFPTFFSRFSLDHPNIQVDIQEDSEPIIREKFIQQELDYAIVVEPIPFLESYATKCDLRKNELVAFMTDSHPLASHELVTWKDVSDYPIITLPEPYLTKQRVQNNFKMFNVSPRIIESGQNWEHLVEAVHDSNAITILPEGSPDMIHNTKAMFKRFNDHACFDVYLTRLKKVNYSNSEMIFNASLEKELAKICK